MSLLSVYGQDLLRYKGILYLQGADREIVLQGVHMTAGTQAFGPWEAAPSPVSSLLAESAEGRP